MYQFENFEPDGSESEFVPLASIIANDARPMEGNDDTDPRTIDEREERLLRSLGSRDHQSIRVSEFHRMLASVGLRTDDERLRESIGTIDLYLSKLKAAEEETREWEIPEREFCQAIRSNILLIERALQGSMVIPEFRRFKSDIDDIYAEARENRDGRAADYIPQLNLQEPEVDKFGVALCTVDGQRHSVGDAATYFAIESACKPMNYCLALEEYGADIVHRHIGHEPSGASFNELALDKNNRPHNPMINAGAIMSCSFIQLSDKQRKMADGATGDVSNRGWAGERINYVMDRWRVATGGVKPRFSTDVYLSERSTADRNFALAYYMREKQAFPKDVDLEDVLDFYFQCCSIEMNAESLSVFAATLANGGICPISGERVFQTETVRKCLSLMLSCGMYDYSGEFAFSIGLPAKSGVSGVMMIIVPNVMGFCCWSPRLDECGNSVRGIDFCQRLVQRFNFHNYDSLTGESDRTDPRVSQLEYRAQSVNNLIWACSKGDIGAIQEQILRGVDIGCQDYDMRTPLHLAAAEDQIGVVRFIIQQLQRVDIGDVINPRDRWGGTPLDDAYLNGCDEIIDLLEAMGGERGSISDVTQEQSSRPVNSHKGDSPLIGEMIWAASTGDLVAVRRLVAQGVHLDLADYDARTPLHLAAAEGHLQIVEYFVAQRANIRPKDRWGNTPLDDAQRHGRKDVVEFLRRNGGCSVET